jgi:prepilin-type N-terminal cleavage/methylation domain-containing protein
MRRYADASVRISHYRGFTIVELLIVIVIVAILATLTSVAYNGMQKRAQLARLSSEASNLERKFALFNAESNTYPTAINDCPTPAATNLCLAAPNDELYTYQVNAANSTRYINSRAVNTSYELQIDGTNAGIYFSNAEKTSGASNEFMQYVDLAPLIDKYGLKKYRLSFDIKSANIATRSTINVYFQNGSNTRYNGISTSVNVTTSYQHYDLEFIPTLADSGITQSILAFYGTYGTGNIPSVRNVKITLAQ